MAAGIILAPIGASLMNGTDGITYSNFHLFLVIPVSCAAISAISYFIAKRSRLAVLVHVILYLYLALTKQAMLPVYFGYILIILMPHILVLSEIKRT